LPPYARGAFSTTEHLNTIQSIVFHAAFETSQSVLVAAPTGAGKTNIALLTIMREIHLLMDKNDTKGPWSCKDKKFRIVYIAPLKALAAEIVEKFEQALKYLDVKVHELTGDIGLTK
jgi:replicative superfamily II helicase